MGMKIFSSASTTAATTTSGTIITDPTSPNPHPFRHRVKQTQRVGDYTVALINYVDCITHKGDKICVFKGAVPPSSKGIDPHFLEEKNSPIARFPGNDEGWDNAMLFIESKDTQDRLQEKAF